MQVYETTFIVNPQLEDAGIDQRVNDISELIAKNGGKLLHTDHMGTRRLAYSINGLTQGYYGCFIYEASENTPKQLERHFRLNDAYIRYLTVRFEGDPENIGRHEEPEERTNDRQFNRPSGPPVGQRRPEAEAARPDSTPAGNAEPERPADAPAEEAPSAEAPAEETKNEEPEQL